MPPGALHKKVVKLYDAEKCWEALSLAKRVLSIGQKALGPDDPSVEILLLYLGELYNAQCRSADAEPCYRPSLAIAEKALGPDGPMRFA